MEQPKKYNVVIEGSMPLIWNVMQRRLELEKKKLKKDELTAWEEKNWQEKAEFDDKGNAIVPDRWMKQCFVEAAKKTRIVPHFATTKRETYTYYSQSMMVMNTGKPVCKKKDLEYFGQYVGAQGKNSTTKVWRVRPMVKKWQAEFTIFDPAGRMNMEELTTILNYAGTFVGLGDNRINNFGRFEVKKLLEVKK